MEHQDELDQLKIGYEAEIRKLKDRNFKAQTALLKHCDNDIALLQADYDDKLLHDTKLLKYHHHEEIQLLIKKQAEEIKLIDKLQKDDSDYKLLLFDDEKRRMDQARRNELFRQAIAAARREVKLIEDEAETGALMSEARVLIHELLAQKEALQGQLEEYIEYEKNNTS